MKKTILLFLVCFSFLSIAQNKTAEDFNFVGKWKGIDKNKTGYFIFEKDGTAMMNVGDKVIGGKDYFANGKKANINYTIDQTSKPITIDFIMSLDGVEKKKRLLFIADIINADSFKIASDFNDERPSGFTEHNTMVFTRVQE